MATSVDPKARLITSTVLTLSHIFSSLMSFLRYRHKLLKWWCQSFLVGIETIYCGFRDDNGVVTSVKEFRVRDLPKMAKVKTNRRSLVLQAVLQWIFY